MEHIFTNKIKEILQNNFGEDAEDIFDKNYLLQYINLKTSSANKGSKSRSSFGTLFAIYVILKDYITQTVENKIDYSKYEGGSFSILLKQARDLPFGEKIQNHAFNNRVNKEFSNRFRTDIQIIHNTDKRYWINENLLKVKNGKKTFNISKSLIEIIDEYIKTKQDAFQRFMKQCEELQDIENTTTEKIKEFILGLFAPNVDARLFEIVSYSILKFYYYDQTIIWGYKMDKLNTENLKLYKTGRTNANDGGIDFVMKPLGRFFQVTETLDFKKYFLDIDKIQKYPITFVIKSDEEVETLKKKIQDNANKTYSINAIVEKYMACIEEVINIPILNERFNEAVKQGYLNNILNEILVQSKVEFNYSNDVDKE